MKVKLSCGLAGDRFSHAPGEVIEREEDEAMRLVQAGLAEAVDEEGAATAASAKATTKATAKKSPKEPKSPKAPDASATAPPANS